MKMEVVFSSSEVNLAVGFETTQPLQVCFGTLHKVGVDDIETYDGAYEVTPTTSGFVLPTEKKMMVDDLTVNGIPYYEVSNTSGGKTVYIGGADEIMIR